MKSTMLMGAALLLAGSGFVAGAEVGPKALTTQPATQPAIPQSTGYGQSMSVSVVNGDKTVDVHQPGRAIHIEENEKGIFLKVTGQIDGSDVTVEFKAKTPEQLKKEHPDAYDLYRKYNGSDISVLGHAPGFPGAGAPDEIIKRLEKDLLEQMKSQNVPEAEQEEVKRLLKQLENGDAPALPGGAGAKDARKLLEKDLQEQLKDTNIPKEQQEEIKKLLKDLENGGAAALPPGAGAKDARKLLEKDLQEQLKGANIPKEQQEEIQKLLKDLENGGAALPPGAGNKDARKLLEKDLQEQLKDANIPKEQQEEIKNLLKDLQNN